MIRQDAVVYTNGLLHVDFAKTCHGLLRGSERFHVLAVIDHVHAGKDAGQIMEGRTLDVPVYPSLSKYLAEHPAPSVFVIGVAFSGGRLPDSCRPEIIEALQNGMTIVNGLHHFLVDDPEFARLAREHDATLVDIRRPRPTTDLRFWTGEVLNIPIPIVPVLGTDCAVGKRTTARFLMEACREAGIRTELIYTGQTGWMQGSQHGFIFDATPNDFISGEIERVLLECARDSAPDLILVEGQGSLRNPSGPCGSEFLISGNAQGVILQHPPGRTFFVDHEDTGFRIPSVAEEIELIRMFGVETLAVTLNEEGIPPGRMDEIAAELSSELNIPVLWPLRDGVDRLIPLFLSLTKQ